MKNKKIKRVKIVRKKSISRWSHKGDEKEVSMKLWWIIIGALALGSLFFVANTFIEKFMNAQIVPVEGGGTLSACKDILGSGAKVNGVSCMVCDLGSLGGCNKIQEISVYDLNLRVVEVEVCSLGSGTDQSKFWVTVSESGVSRMESSGDWIRPDSISCGFFCEKYEACDTFSFDPGVKLERVKGERQYIAALDRLTMTATIEEN